MTLQTRMGVRRGNNNNFPVNNSKATKRVSGGQRDVVDRKLFLSGGADILFVPFSLPFIRPEEIRFYHKPLSFSPPLLSSRQTALCYVINNKKDTVWKVQEKGGARAPNDDSACEKTCLPLYTVLFNIRNQ